MSLDEQDNKIAYTIPLRCLIQKTSFSSFHNGCPLVNKPHMHFQRIVRLKACCTFAQVLQSTVSKKVAGSLFHVFIFQLIREQKHFSSTVNNRNAEAQCITTVRGDVCGASQVYGFFRKPHKVCLKLLFLVSYRYSKNHMSTAKHRNRDISGRRGFNYGKGTPPLLIRCPHISL